MTQILSIGDKLVPGRYQVHARFKKAVNFESGGELASLVNEEGGAGPINIVVEGFDFNTVQSLQIEESRLFIDDTELSREAVLCYQSELVFDEEPDPLIFFSNLQAFKDIIVQYSPPKSMASLIDPKQVFGFRGAHEILMYAQASSASRYMLKGYLIIAVRMMRGLGLGLTPSGDDFNAGIISAYRVAEKVFGRDYSKLIDEIYGETVGSNIISNAFLKCARDGCFTQAQKSLLTALACGSLEEIDVFTKELCNTGATSGADWGAGLFLTLNRI